jgi:hypothetical protein
MVRNINISVLRDLIDEHFNVDGVRRLCQDFDEDYDDLPGISKAVKAGELVALLQRRDQVTELVDRLCSLRPHVQWDYDRRSRIPWPVVVITMIRSEAQQLFENPDDDLNDLLQSATSPGVRALVGRYDIQDRDAWHPFGEDGKTIREALDTFAELTPISENGRSFQVEFEFYSEEFFSENETVRNSVLQRLEVDGCLFIIDGVSLFHAEVLGRVQRDLWGWERGLALFFLSCVDYRQLKLSQLLERRVSDHFPRFFRHHDVLLSPHHGFLIGNEVGLCRTLTTSLKELGLKKHIRPSVRERYEQAGISESGMKDLISEARVPS